MIGLRQDPPSPPRVLVGSLVNKPVNDDPRCVEPVAAP